MFDKKSEYALNKHDQDSIIYISVWYAGGG